MGLVGTKRNPNLFRRRKMAWSNQGLLSLGLIMLAQTVGTVPLAKADHTIPNRREAVLNQNFNGNTLLDVDQLLNLQATAPGARLVSLEVVAASARGLGQAAFVINGHDYLAERLDSQPGLHRTVIDRMLGSDVYNVGLRLQGNTFVQSIAAVVDTSYGPGPGFPGNQERREVRLNQWVQPNQIVHLRQVLNLGRNESGRQVLAVDFNARTFRGMSHVTVLVNGAPVGPAQTVDQMTRTFRVLINRTLDHDIQTLTLRVNGSQVFFDLVGAQLAPRYNPGPVPPGYGLRAQGSMSNFGQTQQFFFQGRDWHDLYRQCLQFGNTRGIHEVNHLHVNGRAFQWNGGRGATLQTACQIVADEASG